jgi:F-type H+-transporting ATPase subunit alpha
MEDFAKFGSELDKATQAQLHRGRRLMELLKQAQYKPLSVGKQIIMFYAASKGYLDDLEINEVQAFEHNVYEHMDEKHPQLEKLLIDKSQIDQELEQKMQTALDECKDYFLSERRA